MFEFSKERISTDEAEVMIKELTESYMQDGFEESVARSMAIANLMLDYEW